MKNRAHAEPRIESMTMIREDETKLCGVEGYFQRYFPGERCYLAPRTLAMDDLIDASPLHFDPHTCRFNCMWGWSVILDKIDPVKNVKHLEVN